MKNSEHSADRKLLARAGLFVSGTVNKPLLLSGAEKEELSDFAERLSAFALCTEKNGGTEACGLCPSCKLMKSKTHPDYVFIEAEDGDKNIRTSVIRERVVPEIFTGPHVSSCKIFVICADELNEQGQNVLLKALEDAPPFCRFFLLSGTRAGVLPTVLSRIQEFRLGGLYASSVSSDDELLKKLIEHWEIMSGMPKAELLTAGFEFFNQRKEEIGEILCLMQEMLKNLLVISFMLKEKKDGPTLNNDNLDCGFPGGPGNSEESMRLLYNFYSGHTADDSEMIHLSEFISEIQKGRQFNLNFEMSICEFLLKFKSIFGKNVKR